MPPKSPSKTADRVLVVGPWRSATSTGCCSGDPEAILGRRNHSHAAPDRVAAADLVRQLRKRVRDGVDVQLVDPRNTMFITAAVWRDARYSGRTLAVAAREVVRATTPESIVVAGVVRCRGGLPDVREVLGMLPESWRDTGY